MVNKVVKVVNNVHFYGWRNCEIS